VKVLTGTLVRASASQSEDQDSIASSSCLIQKKKLVYRVIHSFLVWRLSLKEWCRDQVKADH